LLPLARIAVDTDLLMAYAKGKIPLDYDSISINQISLFELQAKAAKLKVNPNYVTEAIETISSNFRTIPFYSSKVVPIAAELLNHIPDYIDCLIVAAAAANKENLATEDGKICAPKFIEKDTA